MNSKLWQLGNSDLIKGLIVAVFTPVIATLADAIGLPGFDFMTYNWGSLFALGLTSGLAYLLKNFASDPYGRFRGKIG